MVWQGDKSGSSLAARVFFFQVQTPTVFVIMRILHSPYLDTFSASATRVAKVMGFPLADATTADSSKLLAPETHAKIKKLKTPGLSTTPTYSMFYGCEKASRYGKGDGKPWPSPALLALGKCKLLRRPLCCRAVTGKRMKHPLTMTNWLCGSWLLPMCMRVGKEQLGGSSYGGRSPIMCLGWCRWLEGSAEAPNRECPGLDIAPWILFGVCLLRLFASGDTPGIG